MRFKMSFETVREFEYLGMLVNNMREDIWVIPMPKNILCHSVLCILPVRPIQQKLIYIKMYVGY